MHAYTCALPQGRQTFYYETAVAMLAAPHQARACNGNEAALVNIQKWFVLRAVSFHVGCVMLLEHCWLMRPQGASAVRSAAPALPRPPPTITNTLVRTLLGPKVATPPIPCGAVHVCLPTRGSCVPPSIQCRTHAAPALQLARTQMVAGVSGKVAVLKERSCLCLSLCYCRDKPILHSHSKKPRLILARPDQHVSHAQRV